jgi:hypothetical protein
MGKHKCEDSMLTVKAVREKSGMSQASRSIICSNRPPSRDTWITYGVGLRLYVGTACWPKALADRAAAGIVGGS